MRKHFQVEAFPHSLNISSIGSNLRVQFQSDPRYGDFVERASVREVLGLQLPVAALEDVLETGFGTARGGASSTSSGCLNPIQLSKRGFQKKLSGS